MVAVGQEIGLGEFGQRRIGPRPEIGKQLRYSATVGIVGAIRQFGRFAAQPFLRVLAQALALNSLARNLFMKFV
jgi:hypothetical protein